MENKSFNKIFSETANRNGFKSAHGGLYQQSNETIVILNLQKSNYGNYLDLNIKIYIQGIFGNEYKIDKNIVKKDTGDVFLRQPPKYDHIFKLEDKRNVENDLNLFFQDFLNPLTKKALSRKGLLYLEQKNLIYLFPAVKEQLSI